MNNRNNEISQYRTNIRRDSKIFVSGPCEILLVGINAHGQAEILIRTHRDTQIDKIKIRNTEHEQRSKIDNDNRGNF